MPPTMGDGIFDPNVMTEEGSKEGKENIDTSATTLESLKLNRLHDFCRVRRPTIRDARMTEQLEQKQRVERERRVAEDWGREWNKMLRLFFWILIFILPNYNARRSGDDHPQPRSQRPRRPSQKIPNLVTKPKLG
jgi:hypothetical protein